MAKATILPESIVRPQVEGIADLSLHANEFLLSNPEAACSIAADALEVAGANYEAVRELDYIPEPTKPSMVIQAYGPEMIGPAEAASHLKIPEKQVREWVDKGVMIGWASLQHGITIPKEQILGSGKVVPSLKEIVEIMHDPELAWCFLSEKWLFGGKDVRPIDMLKKGKVREVLDAAPNYGFACT